MIVLTMTTNDDSPSEPGPADTEHSKLPAELNCSIESSLCKQMEERQPQWQTGAWTRGGKGAREWGSGGTNRATNGPRTCRTQRIPSGPVWLWEWWIISNHPTGVRPMHRTTLRGPSVEHFFYLKTFREAASSKSFIYTIALLKKLISIMFLLVYIQRLCKAFIVACFPLSIFNKIRAV